MSNSLAVVEFETMQRMSIALYKSGYFGDVKSEAQAIVKVMAGAELGLPPFASMSGIHIIQGKPVLGANVIATLVKNDPRYDYQVTTATDENCTIEWYEDGQASGFSSFTFDEAKRANLTGKDNWKKYPSDMLFARAISRGARRFAPGIFGGAPVYTPDEMGRDTDPDGYVEGEIVPEPSKNSQPPEPTPEPSPAATFDAESMAEQTITDGDRQDVEDSEPAPEIADLDSKIADARAALKDMGTTTLGIVADHIVMTGLYNDRKHVANALNGPDGQALRDKGLDVDMRKNVKATLVVFDWAIKRKTDKE